MAVGVAAALATSAPAATSDNPHGTVRFECSDCHSPGGWKPLLDPLVFDHDETDFPLRKAHGAVDCLGCHSDLVFEPPEIARDCATCHRGDFEATVEPDHRSAGLPTVCQGCHDQGRWNPATSFDHTLTGFPLEGSHRGLDCASCHADGYSATPRDCFACHQTAFQATSDPNHVDAGFDTACESCHSTNAWQPATFDHDLTAFPLQGAHRGVDCASCHADGYTGTPADCFACHQGDFQAASDPNHVDAGFDTACESCHSTDAWQPANFDHDLTAFPLQGSHRGLDCASCHVDGFAGTPVDCFACHQSDFQAASDPNHVTAGFPTTCENCHSTNAWQPAEFDHDLTAFPLQGGHDQLECSACHSDGFAGTPIDCFACHEQDYRSTADPNHVAAGFATTCESCHSTTAWQPAAFDHDETTFPLEGAHRTVDCSSCHADGYAGTPTDCFACHEPQYDQTTDPPHATVGFSTACDSCHGVEAWTPVDFEHDTTGFPLVGAHQAADCAGCHRSGAAPPTDCVACHQTDYQAASDPDHVAAGFPTACESCHTETAWQPADFDHDLTGFLLVGGHAGADCSSCHATGFEGTPTDCFACHLDDYQAVDDPDHAGAGFPTTCESCHTVQAWSPANFDHDDTPFPLDGAHVAADCALCHADGFAGTPTDCFACHQADFAGASDPDHVTAGFPTTCESCHGTSGWLPADFDHDDTGFPLVGAHTQVDCSSCHAQGFAGTPTDCVACHLAQFEATTDPDHADAGFPTSCESCHTSVAWVPATFDHNQTAFPLTGAHVQTDCLACHADGYPGTPTDCFACHFADYDSTTDPNHAAAGFPTTCQTCHDTFGWDDADWDHDGLYFPIFSGRHRDEWTTCQDCHVAPGNFQVFSCLTCHEHNQADTDDEHEDVSGYVYESSACYTCHPDGEE